MPQLVEYVNREGITPTDRGVEARVQQGRRIGASFNQVAESLRDFGNRAAGQIKGAISDAGDAAVAWQDQRQIHQGATTAAGLFNQLTNGMNDTVNSIDPNDPAYSSKVDMALQQWREQKLEPSLQQFREGFTTEKAGNWAESHIDQMRQHFYTSSAAEVARAAGIGVKNGMQNTLTSLSNTVVQDPSAVKTALDLWDNSVVGIVGSAHGINAADAGNAQSSIREVGRKKLVNDAAASAIRKAADPEAESERWVKNWGHYIDGDHALTLGKSAKVQAKANALTDKQTAAYERQQANDAADADAAKNMADNVSVDPTTGRVTLKPEYFRRSLDIAAKYGEAAPHAAEIARTLLNWGQHQQSARRETMISDPVVRDDLYTRIFSEDNPTTDVDIFKAETQDKLDRYDAQNLLNLRKAVEDKPLTGPVWRDTMESVKGLLGTDPKGHEAFGKFVSAFIPEYQRMSRAGTLPSNALDLRDPNSMISQVLSPYRREPQQMFIDRISHGLVPPGDIGNIPQAPGATGRGLAPPKQVKSIEDAQKLNPGTRYITPDGKIFIR